MGEVIGDTQQGDGRIREPGGREDILWFGSRVISNRVYVVRYSGRDFIRQGLHFVIPKA